MPGLFDGDAAEPDALILAPDILKDRKSRDATVLSRQKVSAGRIVNCRGMLCELPPADEPRVTFAAFDAHDVRDVGFGRGLDLHIFVTVRRLSGQGFQTKVLDDRLRGHLRRLDARIQPEAIRARHGREIIAVEIADQMFA